MMTDRGVDVVFLKYSLMKEAGKLAIPVPGHAALDRAPPWCYLY